MRCQPVGGACAMACGARSQACVSAVRCPLSGVCAGVVHGGRERAGAGSAAYIYLYSVFKLEPRLEQHLRALVSYL
jgi:hypothetical protein